MLKRGILLFFLFSGVLSCLCDDEKPFWNIKTIDILAVDLNGNNIDTDTITTDSIGIVVDIDLLFVTQNSLKNIFINTAMATSCPQDGLDGMKDPITNITLTCDQDYNSFAAGVSLNSIVRYHNQEGFQNFIDEVKDFPAVDFFSFFIVEKPTNIDSLSFNLQIDFASGQDVKDSSGVVYWQ